MRFQGSKEASTKRRNPVPWHAMTEGLTMNSADRQSLHNREIQTRISSQLGPIARTWRRPLDGCGVASPQHEREALPPTITQSALVGLDPRRLAGAPGASRSSAPTLLGFHKATSKHKYRMVFSPSRRRMPGPKGPGALGMRCLEPSRGVASRRCAMLPTR
jgi:hypothetical protein